MKPIRNQLTRFAVLVCLSGSLTLSVAAEGQIEEIYVTATKRQQTLQEVPVAVSVTGADTIEKAKILDLSDLQSIVPSLRITTLQSSTNTNFIIRGFGNGANNAGIEPSVGVFIDGVYRSRSASAIADLPNLQRVEVLRGPQSTLFGKNASAGVISVITAKPTHEFGGSAEVTVGNYGLAVLKADVSSGITDELAFSLSGSVNQRDGYFENLENTSSAFNDKDRNGVRGQLLYTPTDNQEYRLIVDADTIDENCCGVANLLDGPTGGIVRALGGNLIPNDGFAYANYFNKASQSKVDNDGISLQADINFNNFDLTSITSHRNQELAYNQDADFGSAELLGNVGLTQDIQTITQEIRFTSNGDGDIEWMVGGFFFKEDVAARGEALFGNDIRPYGNALLTAGTNGALNLASAEALASAFNTPNPLDVQNFSGQFYVPGTGAIDALTQTNDATSLFGQVDWHISDKSTLTVGLNHTKDEKDVTGSFSTDAAFGNLNFGNIFFNQTFFNSFGGFGALVGTPGFFPATPTNIAIIAGIPANGPLGAASGAQTLAAIRAGTTAAGNGLIPLQFLPGSPNFPNAVEGGSSKDSKNTYTLRFAHDIDDAWNVYASYGTGFKASSWNLSRDSRPLLSNAAALTTAGLLTARPEFGTRFAGPEEATVLEIGAKTKFDKGALNFAIFSQNIEGFQSNTFSGTGFNLTNAGKQSTGGIELDFTYDVTDNLNLSFGGTWLDPTYDSFVSGLDENGPADLSGTSPAGIHELSTSTSATYNMTFSNGWDGYIRGDYLYESATRVNENTPAEYQRQVNSLNTSFGVNTNSGWGFTLWGRNITNDEYLLSTFPSVAQAGSYSGYPNQPRTYGLSVKKTF